MIVPGCQLTARQSDLPEILIGSQRLGPGPECRSSYSGPQDLLQAANTLGGQGQMPHGILNGAIVRASTPIAWAFLKRPVSGMEVDQYGSAGRNMGETTLR